MNEVGAMGSVLAWDGRHGWTVRVKLGQMAVVLEAVVVCSGVCHGVYTDATLGIPVDMFTPQSSECASARR